MTSTIQQNEDEPSSHLGFRSGRPYLNEREKVLVKELLRKYCSRDDWEDGSACSTNECFVQTYAVGKSAHVLATRFFYAVLAEDVEESKYCIDNIIKLPREYIGTSLLHLASNLWVLYDHMLEIEPELDRRVRNTKQRWVENEYKKEFWE